MTRPFGGPLLKHVVGISWKNASKMFCSPADTIPAPPRCPGPGGGAGGGGMGGVGVPCPPGYAPAPQGVGPPRPLLGAQAGVQPNPEKMVSPRGWRGWKVRSPGPAGWNHAPQVP